MTALRLVLTAAAALLGAAVLTPAAPAAAQASCTWVDPTRNVTVSSIPGLGQVVYLSRPSIRCTDGVRFQSDSAVAYPSQNLTHLMGSVRFRDGGKELTSDEARYFSRQGRLQANGRVVLRDTAQGSEIRNGDLVLLRKNDLREQDQITVTTGPDLERPVATLVMRSAPRADTAVGTGDREAQGRRPTVLPDTVLPDTVLADTIPADTIRADTGRVGAEPPPRPAPPDTVATPYVVHGDRLFFQGSAYFLATGSVVVDRDSLLAFADTAEYDEAAERMLLRGGARVEGARYTMAGQTVNIALPGGEMRSVRAARDATLTGDDLLVEAPLIQMLMAGGAMERLVATPLPGEPSVGDPSAPDSAGSPDGARPVAQAEGFRLTADSLDVVAPGERLERMVAVGKARGETSSRDSLNVAQLPEVARSDWMEGDTLVAVFSRVEPDPDLPPDTLAPEYRLEEIQAMGSARTLYRFAPEDSTFRAGVDAPGVHYATGSRILIVFVEGEVDRMEMEGPSRGWHLEPMGRRAAQDSLSVPDSAVVPPPDTGSAAPQGRARSAPGPGSPGPGGPADGGGGVGVEALPVTGPGQRERGRGSRR